MATNRAKKAEVMEEIRAILKDNRNIVLAEYRGLNVEQMTALRANMRKAGVRLKVLKNTISQKLFDEAGMKNLDGYLKGPMMVGFFVQEDIAASAKAVLNYAKSNELFVVKAGYLDGKVISVDGVKALASLPPKPVMLAMLLATMQAPVKGMMTVMQGNTQKLVYALNALKEQKEKQAA
jgi:large subunit ribosomal protein L10